MTDPSALSAVAQDYLKVIWTAGEWSTAPVTTKMLAERIGVGASTVSETVRRLADQGLVTHEPYGSIGLTETGERLAVAMVRRHRLIETFLVRDLGYAWDEVHDEAEVLEHAVSDRMMARIDARLGHPTRDPHGDPIPTPDGRVPTSDATVLWEAAPGRWTVERVADDEPERLRYLAEVGVVPDAVVEVVERREAIGTTRVRVGERSVDLGEVAASAIWLQPAG